VPALSVKVALSDPTLGQPLLTLALADPDQVLRAFATVQLLVTPTGDALTRGLCPPVLFECLPPSGARRAFSRVVTTRFPGFVTFTPQEGGVHLLVVREKWHNRWYGAIQLDVAGAALG
jgi:hypothetical protein